MDTHREAQWDWHMAAIPLRIDARQSKQRGVADIDISISNLSGMSGGLK